MSYKTPVPPREELYALYTRTGSTISSVAKHYGTSQPTVRKWLIAYDIPRKDHTTASQEANNRHIEGSITSKTANPKSPKTHSSQGARNSHNIKVIDLDAAYEMYVEGMPLVRIAPLFGLSNVSLKSKLTQAGFQLRSHSENQRLHVKKGFKLTDDEKAQKRAKSIATNLERRGVEHHTKTEEYLAKRTQTLQSKYGVSNAFELATKTSSWFATDDGKRWIEKHNPAFSSESQKRKWLNKLTSKTTDRLFAELVVAGESDKVRNLLENRYVSGETRFDIAANLNISYSYLCAILRNLDLSDMFPSTLYKGASQGEQEVAKYVQSLGFNVLERDRSILGGKELDIVVPSKNLAIEYNGLYWHSEHTGNKDSKYHLLKTEVCEASGKQLLHILDVEWCDPRRRKIWESIISAKLGVFKQRIYARSTSVCPLTPTSAREFYESNHLEGFAGAREHWGLVHGVELVAAMSFSPNRFARNEWEVVRFANKINVQVVGGRSKLLSLFKHNSKLISYANRRFSSPLTNSLSNDYTATPPNWWGFKHGEYVLKHRMQFQRHRFVAHDDNRDVFDIMIERGFDRYWDCGSLKYVVKK